MRVPQITALPLRTIACSSRRSGSDPSRDSRDTMISKLTDSATAAVSDVHDGSTVMIGGFGSAGEPIELIDALLEQGATDLTIVSNNAGNGSSGLAALLRAGRVQKIICSFPRQADSHAFDDLYRDGKLELELVPQGTLFTLGEGGSHAA